MAGRLTIRPAAGAPRVGDGGNGDPGVGRSLLRGRIGGASPVAMALTVVAATGIGALVAVSPIVGLAAAAGVVAIGLLSLGRAMVPVFHGFLLFILVAYAFLGRGAAHLGARPVYIGEVALGLALIAIAVSVDRARWRPVHLAIALFAVWGALRTIPYVGRYDIDALRDAVTWGYAVFAVAVSLTVRAEHIERVVELFRRFAPAFVLWVPIAAASTIALSGILPRTPGSDVPIIVFKGGDMGVHLAGVGAFLIVGLGGTGAVRLREGLIWMAWMTAVVTAGAVNRGGLIAASMMMTSIAFMRSIGSWFVLGFVGLFLVAVVGLADPQIDLGFHRRISLDQIVANVTSIFGSSEREGLEGTKTWRLRWWNTIFDYTLDGPYFWDGKGFGVNLADDDGFQLLADHSLRAPHNGHVEILARAGVPGVALWILLQIVFGLTLLRAAYRARAAALTRWVAISGWIFAWWLASLVNASFDVYLQGPQGGIWFWSIMGLGIAVATAIDRLVEAARAPDEPPTATTKPPPATARARGAPPAVR